MLLLSTVKAYNGAMRLAERLAAPALDLLLLLCSFWWLPVMRRLFDARPALMVLPVCLGYLGLCAGIWCLKLISQPAVAPSAKADLRGCALGLSAMVYAGFVLGMLIFALTGAGHSGAGGAMERLPGEHPLLFGLVVAAMLLWVGLFPASAMFAPRARFAAGTPAALGLRLAGVAAVSYMVLLTGAWIQTVFDMGAWGEVRLAQRLVLFALYYLLFLLFYAAPRLMLVAIDGDKYSLLSLLIMLACFVWPLTA